MLLVPLSWECGAGRVRESVQGGWPAGRVPGKPPFHTASALGASTFRGQVPRKGGVHVWEEGIARKSLEVAGC